MQARKDHYMKADMLQSQFNALEPPNNQEAYIISIDKPIETIVQDIIKQINSPPH
jgi:gluconokinase